jgi:hypothetical protein
LDRIIKALGLEKLAFRLHNRIKSFVGRVDVRTYSMFRAVMLKEGDEWDDDFADESEEHRQVVQEVADRFYEVSNVGRA